MSTTVKEVLAELAPLAKEGVRTFILIGKTMERAKRTKKDDTGEVVVKQEVVYGEGRSIKLKYGPDDLVPGIGFEGAFEVANPQTYQGYKSADCIGFA